MVKSSSALQNQIDGCERTMQECIAICADEIGEDTDFKVTFSFKDFIQSIPNNNTEEALDSVRKMLNILGQCEKILLTEVKRRAYRKELRANLKRRESRDTVKRLTTHHRFNKHTEDLKIPSPPQSLDE